MFVSYPFWGFPSFSFGMAPHLNHPNVAVQHGRVRVDLERTPKVVLGELELFLAEVDVADPVPSAVNVTCAVGSASS